MAFVMSLAMAFTSVDTGLLVSAEDVTTVAEESTVEVQDVEEEAEGEDVEVADGDVEEEIVTDGEVAEQAFGEEGAMVIEPQDTNDMVATFGSADEGIIGGGAGDGEAHSKRWYIDENEMNERIMLGQKKIIHIPVYCYDEEEALPDTLKYRWYDDDEKLISETKENEFIVDADGLDYMNHTSKTYKCIVSDTEYPDDTEEIMVYVYAGSNNGTIKIYNNEQDSSEYDHTDDDGEARFITVANPGQDFELSFLAKSTKVTQDELKYQWYKETNDEYVAVTDVTGNVTYKGKTELGAMGEYCCVVTDGTSLVKVYFEVYPDSGFEYKSGDAVYIEKEDASVTLHAEAKTARGTLNYKWYKNDDEKTVLSTTADLTVVAKWYERYTCYVTDGYEEAWINYYITPNKPQKKANLSVSAPEKVAITKGESVTLEVFATADVDINYSWYSDNGDDLGSTAKCTFIPDTDDVQMIHCNVWAGDEYEEVIILVGSQEKLNKVVAQATSFETARTLTTTVPEAIMSYKDGTKQYFKFIPDKDGVWNICGGAAELVLYNAAKEKLCSTGDAWRGVTYRLKTNETYYLEVVALVGDSSIEAQYMDYNVSHKWKEAVITKTATCTTAGEKAKECASCDMIYYETIPALGHTFNAFTVTKEASVLEEGSQYHTCSVCGTVETVAIPKLVSNVTLINSTLPLQVKQKASLSKNVKGLAKGDKIVSCTLSAKDKKIVSVDKKGTVKGKKAGTATITMKFLSGATAKVKVKVQKKKVATSKITNVTKNITLKVKKSTKLAPFVTPVTSKNKVTYKTSNKKIATVSSKGVIKAKKAGTATITVKSGSKTVKVKVKVTK